MIQIWSGNRRNQCVIRVLVWNRWSESKDTGERGVRWDLEMELLGVVE